jgi:hypothetical protein
MSTLPPALVVGAAVEAACVVGAHSPDVVPGQVKDLPAAAAAPSPAPPPELLHAASPAVASAAATTAVYLRLDERVIDIRFSSLLSSPCRVFRRVR